PGSARGTLRALCRPPSAPAHEPTALRRQGPPGPLPARQLLSRPQFLLQSTRQLEVLGASIRFVQDVEVHPAHPDASEAIRTSGEPGRVKHVSAVGALRAGFAMLAVRERGRLAAVRTIGATHALHTIVTAHQRVRLAAERAATARLAIDALHAARIFHRRAAGFE